MRRSEAKNPAQFVKTVGPCPTSAVSSIKVITCALVSGGGNGDLRPGDGSAAAAGDFLPYRHVEPVELVLTGAGFDFVGNRRVLVPLGESINGYGCGIAY
jgi:hypothetical protein